MMRTLYSIGIAFYTLGVRIASLWMGKARLMKDGWPGTWRALAKWKNIGAGEETAWFHASSLGEFEQARPVLERYRELHPQSRVVLTFFSPSGYEVRKNYKEADLVCYLPMDSRGNARRFVKTVRPTVAFFAKYDFWFNYLNELKRCSVPTYLFSAIFRPTQYFFHPYGRWFCKQLDCYTHIFVQNQESLDLLHRHGITRSSLAGDTRFDRVDAIARTAPRYPEIEQFVGGRQVLMAGSSWEPDEANIAAFAKGCGDELCVILAPHVISESHLNYIENLFGPERTLRYSALKQGQAAEGKRVLVIDNIGMLSSLYQYATVAYIGGGFGKGIHNTLEAMTYAKPVCFGPRYGKFKEAVDIIERGGGRSYTTAEELSLLLTEWFNSSAKREAAAQECRRYVDENLGTTDIIIRTAQ